MKIKIGKSIVQISMTPKQYNTLQYAIDIGVQDATQEGSTYKKELEIFWQSWINARQKAKELSTKRCWNCFKTKDESEFYTRRYKGKIGTQTRCKACNNEVVRAWKKRSDAKKIKARFDALCGESK